MTRLGAGTCPGSSPAWTDVTTGSLCTIVPSWAACAVFTSSPAAADTVPCSVSVFDVPAGKLSMVHDAVLVLASYDPPSEALAESSPSGTASVTVTPFASPVPVLDTVSV